MAPTPADRIYPANKRRGLRVALTNLRTGNKRWLEITWHAPRLPAWMKRTRATADYEPVA